MGRLVLVRHGEAAAGWGEDHDPGLSEQGRAQAEAVADALAPLGPLPILVSPMRRTVETAAALERRWDVVARVEPAVGEVPSPTDDLPERAAWLAGLFRMPWDAWPPELVAWRRGVVDRLLAIEGDAVVVTHFVALRAAAGLPDYMPDYCSCTVVETGSGGLRVVELGETRATVVR